MCNVLYYQRGCCEEAKAKSASARQSMCEHRVSRQYKSQPYSSLGTKTHISLCWATAAAASLIPASRYYSPVTCATAMQAHVKADAALVKRRKLYSCEQLTWPGTRSSQLMSVNRDESTSRLLPSPSPDLQLWASSCSELHAIVYESCQDMEIKIFDLPERKGLTDKSKELWWSLVYQASVGLEINTPKLPWPEIRLI